jgi:Protein of unknown function (DUF2911)
MDFLPTLALVVVVIGVAVFFLLRYSASRSPAAVAESSQNGLSIKVKYCQPSKRDRVIFGKVVPYDKLWRTGANAATMIELGRDVLVAGQPLPKGRYSFFTIPTPTDWTVIFNRQTGQWGVFYKEEKDALRVTVPTRGYPSGAEQFFVGFEPQPGGMNMLLTWEQTQVVVPFRTN